MYTHETATTTFCCASPTRPLRAHPRRPPAGPTFVFLAAAAPLPRQAVVVVERRQLNQTQPADLLRVPGADVTDVRQAELVRLRNEMLQQTQVQKADTEIIVYGPVHPHCAQRSMAFLSYQ